MSEVIMVGKRISMYFLFIMLMLSSATPTVAAEDGDGLSLADVGLRLVSMRNDTALDTNDDGQADAFRVVVVLNATAEMADVNMVLLASTGPRTIEQWVNTSIEGQENFSITIESWEVGQYSMTLQMYDPQSMSMLVNLDLGSYWFEPALSLPTLRLSLAAPAYLQTGDSCQVTRVFTDEVGFRYGMMGSRTFTGAPFQVYASDEILDCGDWPAGAYSLSESYQNGLGQTSEVELTFSIHNRPAPAFILSTFGDGDETGTTCSVTLQPQSTTESLSSHQRVWEVIPNQVIGNVSSIDCSQWAPGIHKVVVTVTNGEEISTTRGLNIVRLPPLVSEENHTENTTVWPTRSLGSEVAQNQNGWYAIGGASLVVFLLTLLMTRKSQNGLEDEAGETYPSPEEILLSDGLGYVPPVLTEPDTEGLPTFTDEEGIMWRRHVDGQVDWWDYQKLLWVRFE
jgi:hypothetical protein